MTPLIVNHGTRWHEQSAQRPGRFNPRPRRQYTCSAPVTGRTHPWPALPRLITQFTRTERKVTPAHALSHLPASGQVPQAPNRHLRFRAAPGTAQTGRIPHATFPFELTEKAFYLATTVCQLLRVWAVE